MILDKDLDMESLQLFLCSNPFRDLDDSNHVSLSSFRDLENAFDLSMMTATLPFNDAIASQHGIMKFSEFETLSSFPHYSNLGSSGSSSDVDVSSAGEMTVDLDATDSLISHDDTAFSTATLCDDDGLLSLGQVEHSITASNSATPAGLQLITPNSPDNSPLPSNSIPTRSSNSSLPTISAVDSSKTGQHVFQLELATKPKR
jgi:hypothetical protein